MPTTSPHLNLQVPATTDNFVTADIAGNWNKIDASPGALICTSTNHPNWNSGNAGQRIWEADTQLEWWWDGAAFHRSWGVGWLGGVTRNGSTSTTSINGRIQAVGPLGITIPAGGRAVMLVASWKISQNTVGNSLVSIIRGNKDTGSGMETQTAGNSSANTVETQGTGGDLIFVDHPPAGAQTYSLYVRCSSLGGTSYIAGDANQPLQLDAIEI